jgi:hypothetical protein
VGIGIPTDRLLVAGDLRPRHLRVCRFALAFPARALYDTLAGEDRRRLSFTTA